MNISVYVLDITQLLDEDVLMRYMALTTPKRREKAERFKNTADKARCIGAGILLAHAYNHYQNIQRESAGAGSLVVFGFSDKGVLHMRGMGGNAVRELKQGDGLMDELLENLTEKLPEELINERGKPYFAGGPCFNLSHAGNKVVCAMAPFEVGIDVECVRPCKDAVMKKCFTQEETAAVKAAGRMAQEETVAVKASKVANRKEERNTGGETNMDGKINTDGEATGSSAGCREERNQGNNADRVFTEIWTQKEARAKLSGKGIADIFHMGRTGHDLTSCVHTIWLDDDYVLSVAADRQLWHL